MAADDDARLTRLHELLDQLNDVCSSAESLRGEVERQIASVRKGDRQIKQKKATGRARPSRRPSK